MKGVIKELLMEFYQCNSKMKPERLVFYRDGVSEGQFEAVQRLEIPQASPRCHSIDATLSRAAATLLSCHVSGHGSARSPACDLAACLVLGAWSPRHWPCLRNIPSPIKTVVR